MPPTNFGRAFDLSSLGKPKENLTQASSSSVTVENLMPDFVQVSKEKPVLLLAFAERAPQSAISLRSWLMQIKELGSLVLLRWRAKLN
jgi:thioredoxin-like negative regulator of GroEL